ncbi:MAG: tRNA preQ1(34) S-adenosylmethionine ribosyltransferase-isomerase QueA [Planctomycetota bacterium]|jgi:S-adenosylmethionine:tRNA ribosyltransferase-isomerase|nr:tRNA preQ1(34) S-adenosylmethionine ribosyltransferase-isomerase QueA [Planctomycetota bacterium]
METDSLISSYSFDLPPERIAQRPADRRDASRLMLLRRDGTTEDRIFSDLPELLEPGDILIRNNARVLRSRLIGRRRGGGAAEILAVRRDDGDGREAWLCLARPANRFKPGREFVFADGRLSARALGQDRQGLVRMEFSLFGDAFLEALEKFGQVPLPPYIERSARRPTPEDGQRYQTHYASRPGAAAAPTAGLHFTPELDRRLLAKGIGIAELTLQVGPGTFRPVKAKNLDNHRMDAEWYEVPEAAWRQAIEARVRGGRLVAVGTTSARALESAALGTGGAALSGWTDILIRPGHRFSLVDGLVTNFHPPGSTPLVLAAALAGRETLLAAYAGAVEGGYRFYSYGDAMLIWRAEKG